MDAVTRDYVETALAWLMDAGEGERPFWWQMAVSNLNDALMEEVSE